MGQLALPHHPAARSATQTASRLQPVDASVLLPALVERAGPRAARRFLEFFTAEIRNPHTRRSYAAAVGRFLTWCDDHRCERLEDLEPVRIAAWVEDLARQLEPATVKQHLAAVRMHFDYLGACRVTGA